MQREGARKSNLSGFSPAALGRAGGRVWSQAQDPGGQRQEPGGSACPTNAFWLGPPDSPPSAVPSPLHIPPTPPHPRPRSGLRPPLLSRLSHRPSTATDPSPGCRKGFLADTGREVSLGAFFLAWGQSLELEATIESGTQWARVALLLLTPSLLQQHLRRWGGGGVLGRWEEGERDRGRRDPRSGDSRSPPHFSLIFELAPCAPRKGPR